MFHSHPPLPPPSGPTQRPTQPRIRLFPGQLRSSASFRSHALAHPALPPCSRLPRVVFGLPAPCSLPFLRPRPSCLRRAPGPTLSPPPGPRAPRPAPTAASSALPLPLPDALSRPCRLPFPAAPCTPPPLPFPTSYTLHVHARCAHAREFSRALFARLKK